MTEATLWCNGSTNDFGSFSRSSNLCGVAIFLPIGQKNNEACKGFASYRAAMLHTLRKAQSASYGIAVLHLSLRLCR